MQIATKAPASSSPQLPPLWLAASALAAGIAVAFGVVRWLGHFLADPNAEDFRLQLVAARIGVRDGWSHIYDFDLQRAASAGIGPIDSAHLFVNPPPIAWIAAPLTGLPVSTGYLIWTLISLAAFVAAWCLVCSGSRLAAVTVLLVSLAVWPVHYQFWLGQWVAATLALVALSWWMLEHDRWWPAGVGLALAFFIKPQDVLLVPVALLVSGRWKPVAACVLTGAFLTALSAASLGAAGMASWLHDIDLVRTDPQSATVTYSFLFKQASLATGLEVGLGLSAVVLAWCRRDRLDLVFALGIAGTTASATHLHEDDIAMLVLAAWIVLRAAPSVTQRAWLLAGIAAAQFLAIGSPIPILVWQPVWIALLALEPRLKRLERRHGTPGLASSHVATSAGP
ncbi:MAG: glycosyltransferase family 87 protein [Candidatus Dormibacteraceae bacterium]